MRNILKKVATTLIYATLGCAAICTLTTSTSASNYKGNFERVLAAENRPAQVARWKRTPTVVVCDYAPLSEIQAKSAVAFWENLGHRFFRTQYKYDPLKKCMSSTPVGYVVIHLVTQGIKLDDSALAETHFYVNNDTNEIEWAIIYLRSDVKEAVLEHEIGHALGFLHFNKIDHLMNEKWTMGGWSKEGLENRRR